MLALGAGDDCRARLDGVAAAAEGVAGSGAAGVWRFLAAGVLGVKEVGLSPPPDPFLLVNPLT